MTSVSKNVCIDKLDDIINKYNNSCHREIQMKPINVNSIAQIDFGFENDDKYPKSKVGNHVRIPKYKNIFVKCYTLIWPEEVFFIKNVKSTVR